MPPQPPRATRNVRLAAQDLRDALDLPEDQRAARVRDAKRWLVSAADEQGESSSRVAQLYFTGPAGESPAAEPTGADALAAILADAEVATTLIAAGHALGESGTGLETAPLDDAISSLHTFEAHTDAFAMQNFQGEPIHSKDPAAATQTLRSRTDETLRTFVMEARSAGGQVVEKLSKVDAAKALEALSQLGGPMQKLPEFGELVKKGIAKLQGVADSLMKLLGDAGFGAVKEKLTAFWSKLKDGTLVDSLLGWVFGRESIETALDRAAGIPAIVVAAFDSASDSIPLLGDSFKGKMSWAKTLTGIVAAGAGLLLCIGAVAGGPLAIFTAGTYLLILAAILLIGRNYAGDGGIFVQGKGLRATIESLTV
jgi:hypothetical protein